MEGLQPLKPCAKQLWALSETLRLRLFISLLQQEQDVSELAKRLKSDYYGVSHHLRILRRSGLVGCRRDAKRRIHFIPPGVIAGLGREFGCIDINVAGGELRFAM